MRMPSWTWSLPSWKHTCCEDHSRYPGRGWDETGSSFQLSTKVTAQRGLSWLTSFQELPHPRRALFHYLVLFSSSEFLSRSEVIQFLYAFLIYCLSSSSGYKRLSILFTVVFPLVKPVPATEEVLSRHEWENQAIRCLLLYTMGCKASINSRRMKSRA